MLSNFKIPLFILFFSANFSIFGITSQELEDSLNVSFVQCGQFLKKNSEEIVSSIINKELDANFVNQKGDSLLHLFCMHHIDVAFLLDQNIDPNILNNNSETPLITAIKYNAPLSIHKSLIEYGARISSDQLQTLKKNNCINFFLLDFYNVEYLLLMEKRKKEKEILEYLLRLPASKDVIMVPRELTWDYQKLVHQNKLRNHEENDKKSKSKATGFNIYHPNPQKSLNPKKHEKKLR